MNPTQLFDPASSTYTYILYDERSREALIVDPVEEQLERDMAVLTQLGLTLRWTVETHAHADHVTSAAKLAELTGARMAAPSGCDIGTAATQLGDGDELVFGAERVRVLHTPGHTAGSVCFYWERAHIVEGEQTPAGTALASKFGPESRPESRQDTLHVFTGDTLLIGGCGRTDFQSGDPAKLYRSLTEVLFKLPETTIVWPGHDYKERTQTSIAVEKSTNPRIAGKTLDEFVALMNNLNLPPPKRIDEAVPANQRSGLSQEAGYGQANPVDGYAGDIPPQKAYEWLSTGEAVLVDVRTDAEREWVGFVPGAVAVAWKQWPGMALNPDFDQAIQAAAAGGKKLALLCRSGVRSVAAAKRASALGLTAFNILGGFEGDPDDQAHRGHKSGWRHAGLPWKQN
ncbi:MBL fold metallo-hydrolase [Ottowia thiooxydans]|uniref:MBL fold metallo-hydrolase n=1 Tax=Ottowia thiooxydans TaxID=219182 RepID=UPI00041EC259